MNSEDSEGAMSWHPEWGSKGGAGKRESGWQDGQFFESCVLTVLLFLNCLTVKRAVIHKEGRRWILRRPGRDIFMGSSRPTRIILETDGSSLQLQHTTWMTAPPQASSRVDLQSNPLLSSRALKPNTQCLSVFCKYASVISKMIFGNFRPWRQLTQCYFPFKGENNTFFFIINHTVMIAPRALRKER